MEGFVKRGNMVKAMDWENGLGNSLLDSHTQARLHWSKLEKKVFQSLRCKVTGTWMRVQGILMVRKRSYVRETVQEDLDNLDVKIQKEI